MSLLSFVVDELDCCFKCFCEFTVDKVKLMVCMCFYNGRHLNFFLKGPGDSQLIPTALFTHFLTCLPVFNHGGSSFKPVVPGSSIGSHGLQTPRS